MPEMNLKKRPVGRPKGSTKKRRASTPQTTAIVKREDWPRATERRRMPQPSSRDLRRLFLHEVRGMSIEEIATLEGQKTFVIQASLDYIGEWKFRNQLSMLETHAISVAMKSLDGVGKVLEDGMKADKVVYVDRETGDIKTVPDHAMRLKTVAETRSLIETVQPKTPLVQNNTQFNNSLAVSGGSGLSFEAVLRKKREQAGLANEQEIETVDAELASGPTIEEEFAEFGGDGGDEDDEEDEE